MLLPYKPAHICLWHCSASLSTPEKVALRQMPIFCDRTSRVQDPRSGGGSSIKQDINVASSYAELVGALCFINSISSSLYNVILNFLLKHDPPAPFTYEWMNGRTWRNPFISGPDVAAALSLISVCADIYMWYNNVVKLAFVWLAFASAAFGLILFLLWFLWFLRKSTWQQQAAANDAQIAPAAAVAPAIPPAAAPAAVVQPLV